MEGVKIELPHFHGWKNVEEGYYTKTRLKNEFGLKPYDESKPDATAKLYMGNKWGDYDLYHVDNCIVINKRKVYELPITNKNLAESLYLINKSAKFSRDTKNENYYARNHSVVQAAKTRQNKLYNIKEAVLNKLLTDGVGNVKGYHVINGKCYKLYELEGFSFHMPINFTEAEHLIKLGTLEGQISSDKTINVSINFFEAENLLNRFINNN